MPDNAWQSSDPELNRLPGRQQPRDLSEHVARTIGLRVVAGALPPGAALPTEHQLCAQLGVSRPAVREGFRLLAARGLIHSRRKAGAMVRPKSDWNMLDAEVLAWHLEQEPTAAFIDGLFEARSVIEPAAAAMAARRAAEADIEAIRASLDGMVTAQADAEAAPAPVPAPASGAPGRGRPDLDRIVVADLRFHRAVLVAAGNRFIATFGAAIGSSLVVSFRLNWQAHKSPPTLSIGLHRSVLAAIDGRQPAEAERRMRRLLDEAHHDARAALRSRLVLDGA